MDYKVAKLNNGTLSITLSIPTIQKDEYSLYKLHRLPSFTNVGHNNIYTRVLYNNDYLGVGNTSHRTFFLTEQEKNNKIECRSENIYLKIAPVISLEVNCESELLLRNTMSCPRDEDYSHEPVLEVIQGGVLYSMIEETKAKIKCSGYNQVKRLSGFGLVRLPPSCEMTIGNNIYKGNSNIEPRIIIPKGDMYIKDIAKFITTTERITLPTEKTIEKKSCKTILEEHKFKSVLVITFALTIINMSILIIKIVGRNKTYRPIEQMQLDSRINSPE